LWFLCDSFKFACSQNWLCDFSGLECNESPPFMHLRRIEITCQNICDILYPLSVMEWHYNIVEYCYTNHDYHRYLRKHEGLLHISFINNNFYENPIYKRSPKICLFI